MSAINIDKISIAHWYPDLERHKCGYCKHETGAVSYGMWAEQLTVEDYQNLIDRGWRRSGMYCYKPMMDQTCCPQYTIRCSALDFQLSKSQKKNIKKVNKFLSDGVGSKEVNRSKTPTEEECMSEERLITKKKPSNTIDFSKLNGTEAGMNSEEAIDLKLNIPSTSTTKITESIEEGKETLVHEPTNVHNTINIRKGVGADPNKPICKKAKLMRMERKQQKLLQKGMAVEKPSCSSDTKSLEQFLNEIPGDSKHKLTMKLVSTAKFDKEMENSKHIEFELYKKYQMTVHNDPPEKCTIGGFTRFLVTSPLKVARVRGENSVVTFGTFHQQYWLDDKLIAVAVLDILPRSVSSVYFFYDPDYRFLTLGTYGSLREIQFVRSLHKSVPSIKFYYMGFYIHSCPKMRYKGKLSHSYLLCPETYQWWPIDKSIVKLTVNKYSRLTDDIDALDENVCSEEDIDRIRVCVSYSFTLFGNYKRKYGEQEVFDNIGRLIGKECASNLLFVSSRQ